MVDRASQEVQVGTGGGAQYQQSGAGFKQPDTNKFATSGSVQSADTGTSTAMRMLSSIVQIAAPLADQYVKKSTAEAYLRGAAAAGTIQSEDELETNPITANWAKAGYRDTIGKLAIADNLAEVSQATQIMRESSPEEFNQFLSEKRRKLLPQMEGMSLEARKTLMSQSLLNDRSAIKQHGAQHYKFIMEQKAIATKTGWDAAVGNMNSAKLAKDTPGNDPVANLQDATQAAFGFVHAQFADPTLPSNIKFQQIGQMASAALQEGSDNTQLYETMRDTVVKWPDGTSHPILDGVPFEQAAQLNKEYVQAKGRQAFYQSAAASGQLAKWNAEFDDPLKPMPAWDDIQQFAMVAHQKWPDWFTEGKRDSLFQQWNQAAAKKAVTGDLASAAQVGDFEAMRRLNKTPAEGLDAWDSIYGRKMEAPARMATLIGMGLNGNDAAFTKAGQQLAPTITQMMVSDKIDPAGAASAKQVIITLNDAEDKGHRGAFQTFAQSMQPDARDLFMDIRDNLRTNGGDATGAVMTARATQLKNQQVPKGVRDQLSMASDKDAVAFAQTLTAAGYLGTAWDTIKGLRPGQGGTAQQQRNALTVTEGLFESPGATAAIEGPIQQDVVEGATLMNRRSPYSGIEANGRKALADTVSRMIPTESGPIVWPRNQALQQVFPGIDPSVQADRVGAAIDKMVPTPKDARMQFTFGNNGEMLYQAFSKKTGQPISGQSGILDPRSVAPVIKQMQQDMAERAKAIAGAGVTVNDKTFNGDNTAGLGNGAMFDFRKVVAQHEGAGLTPAPDVGKQINTKTGKPVMTVGGVSDTNDFYPEVGPDGKVTAANMSQAFTKATNAAMVSATKILPQINMAGNVKAAHLLGEIAYQAGAGNLTSATYKPLLGAMRDLGTGNNPVEELKKTPVYKMSGESRRKYYENTLNQIMKEYGK